MHVTLDCMSNSLSPFLAHLDFCLHRNGEVVATTVPPLCPFTPLPLVSTVRQRPHHKVLVLTDLIDRDCGEVRQQIRLVCRAGVQVHPSHLGKLDHVGEVHWTALDVVELRTEEQWLFAFQKSVYGASAVHSFHAASFPQPDPLTDLPEVEEKGLCWHLLLAVVNGFVEDLQCLQRPIGNTVCGPTCNDMLCLVADAKRVACTTHEHY